MKRIFAILIVAAVSFAACKGKKEVNNTTDSANKAVVSNTVTPTDTAKKVITPAYSDPDTVGAQKTPDDPNAAMTLGKVSHRYIKGGCTSVLLVANGTSEEVLIPKDKLPAELDKDGQAVRFEYRSLRMPNPGGCTTGKMIEVLKIVKAQ